MCYGYYPPATPFWSLTRKGADRGAARLLKRREAKAQRIARQSARFLAKEKRLASLAETVPLRVTDPEYR